MNVALATRWLVAGAVLAVGCGGLQGTSAWQEYQAGHYLQAAELFDREGEYRSLDQYAIQARDQSRTAALREMLADVTSQRASGDQLEATKLLGQFFTLRDTWHAKLAPATTAALPPEVTAAGEFVEAAVLARASKVGLASSGALARAFDPVLRAPELAPWREDLRTKLTERAAQWCGVTATQLGANTPYLHWALATYCKQWGYAGLVVPALPGLHANLVVEGTIDGAHAEEIARLRDALATAFRASGWFAPGAAGPARATLDGRVAMTTRSSQVARSALWTQGVPTVTYQTVSVPTEEPYEETVTRTVDDGGVTKQVSRTVIKYRTVYHQERQAVEDVRVDHQMFNYEETEITGDYVGTFHVRLGAELGAITVTLDDHDVQRGLQRDANFPKAAVLPVSVPVMTLAQFAAQEEARLVLKLERALDEQYATQFCTKAVASINPEDAARCAYLDPARLNANAHYALRKIFDADEPEAAKLLVRPNRI